MSIKINNVEIYGWEAAIRGMRNPMNSWANSDSEHLYGSVVWNEINKQWEINGHEFRVGANDLKLMERLAKAGNDHGKYLRMITVTVDITCSLYWYKEFDTYKVGTVANSCSTMHKIAGKVFTLEDFSHEHLTDLSIECLQNTIDLLNKYRELYLEHKNKEMWWQMIQLLPSSYNQLRTIQMNYAVLQNMYRSRKNHKLDEWREFCMWVETLPYAKELICESNE